MTAHRLQSNLGFRLMSWVFRLRDWLRPPVGILQQAGVRPGMTVLDFGCGPGGFSLAAARLVGPEGCVYALDIHPLAIQSIERAAAKQGLDNIRAIPGDDVAQLEPQSMDIVLLYDVLHDIGDPPAVLREIHRVLKRDGVLSISDHHLSEQVLLDTITKGGYFRLAGRSTRTHQFAPFEHLSTQTEE